MKFKIKHIVIAAVNAAAVAGICILTAVGSFKAHSQQYNYAADRWKNGGEGNYTQISSFFSEEAGFSIESVNAVRNQILSQLQTVSLAPEEGKKLCPDAYSTFVGTSSVRCDISGRSDADITAVGGDFFLFRSFQLIDGAYFNEDDLMKDGAVIDKNLAWSLYGSYKVSGMNIYIDGVQFYIAGVIDNPRTEPEQNCIGNLPKAYISYEGASNLSGAFSEYGSVNGFSKITCYECIMPEPVENFAYETIKKQFSEAYKGKVSIVNNTQRFLPSKRAKVFKHFSDYAIKNNSVSYPYWENASRIVEFQLSPIYYFRRILIAVPCITAIWLTAVFIKWLKLQKAIAGRKISIFIDRSRIKIKDKFKRKEQEQTKESKI